MSKAREIGREILRDGKRIVRAIERDVDEIERDLGMSGPVAPTTVPPSITDNQAVPIGVAPQGSNPAGVTAASVAWSSSGPAVTITPSADTLSAIVQAQAGQDGAVTLNAAVTGSDGNVYQASAVLPVAAQGSPVGTPLTFVIVFGTPSP
jgi:hypothetical protein